jgi:leader peptidase (prepilin peptidase) / N-methyltransferase
MTVSAKNIWDMISISWYNLPDMVLIIAMFLGLAVGWLVNFLADVLPIQRKIARPVCPQCGTSFKWQDYFLLNSCQKCHHPRPWRTYLTIFAALGIAALLALYPPAKLGTWLGLTLVAYFGLVIIIDVEHRLIMHIVSLVGIALGLLTGILQRGLAPTLIGGAVGLGIMLVFYFFGMLFARYRARKLGTDDGEEALGFGDVTISGVLGLMLGWPLILAGLVIGILAGGIGSLLMIIFLVATRRYQTMSIFTAYGPYLVLGAALLIFFPQALSFLLGR